MSANSLRTKLLADSNSIYRRYYSANIPITKMGGGIGHEIDLAIEVTSNLTRATRQRCNLYFSINSAILSYLQEHGEVNKAYAKNAPRYLGGTFSIEQLLADEFTREVFLVIVSAVATKLINGAPLLKEKLVNKLSSILKRKTKNNLDPNKIKQHAEGLAINIINSSNIKIEINKDKIQKKQNRKRKKDTEENK